MVLIAYLELLSYLVELLSELLKLAGQLLVFAFQVFVVSEDEVRRGLFDSPKDCSGWTGRGHDDVGLDFLDHRFVHPLLCFVKLRLVVDWLRDERTSDGFTSPTLVVAVKPDDVVALVALSQLAIKIEHLLRDHLPVTCLKVRPRLVRTEGLRQSSRH